MSVEPVVLEEVAADLLRRTLACGATAADVVVVEGDELEVGVRLGGIEKLKQARQKHLGLRVFIDTRSAIVSSADFSAAALSKLADDACALARVIAPDPSSGLPDASELSPDCPDLDLYDDAVAAIDAERAIEWAKEAEQAALDCDARLTNSEGAECQTSTDRIHYASSLGFAGTYHKSAVSLSVVPVATHNGSMQRDYWYSTQRKLAKLESPASVGKKAAERTLRRLGARKVTTCEVPVVFDPELAGGLLGHLAGAISGYSLYKGASFLIGKLGERIAPETVTIIDDGRLAGGLGSKPFDGEGLPTRRNVIVDRGVLSSYLFDCYSARKLGSRSSGNASRSVGSAPGVAPTNFILQAGSTTPADIVRGVGRGLYVTELIGMGVNSVTGDYSRGAVGQWIENGELVYPVEEITIAGNLLEMYKCIEAIGSDLELRHSIAAPTLLIGRMTIAGS